MTDYTELWHHSWTKKKTEIRVEAETQISESARADISSLLIREFIQNALDHPVNKEIPVIVNINIKDIENIENYFGGSLKEHIESPFYTDTAADRQWNKMRRNIADHVESREKYHREKGEIPAEFLEKRGPNLTQLLFDNSNLCLILEDYNTIGLTGSISNSYDSDEDEDTKDENFVSYFFQPGLSKKRKDSGGSHGYGKTSALYASCIESKIVYTRRFDKISEVALGWSFTQPRKYKEEKYPYIPNSSFSDAEAYKNNNNKEIKGITNNALLRDLKSDFAIRMINNNTYPEITSDIGSTGLSVIMPFPLTGLSDERIRLDILQNYSLSIANKKLIVVQHIPKSNGKYRIYDHNTLGMQMQEAIKEGPELRKNVKRRKQRYKKVEMIHCLSRLIDASKGHSPEPDFSLNLDLVTFSVKEAYMKLKKSDIQLYEDIREKYESGEYFHIRVKKQMKLITGKEEKGEFDMFIKRLEENETGYNFLMRKFIIYLDDLNNVHTDNYLCLTIASNRGEFDNEYESFLKDCEPPNHRRARPDLVKNSNIEKENAREYLNCFRTSFELCETLEYIVKSVDLKKIPSKHFKIPLSYASQPQNLLPPGIYVSDQDYPRFFLQATTRLKESFTKSRLKVFLVYGTENPNGSPKAITQSYGYPKLKIIEERCRGIEIIEEKDKSDSSFLVDLHSPDFLIVAEPISKSFKYYVSCKFTNQKVIGNGL